MTADRDFEREHDTARPFADLKEEVIDNRFPWTPPVVERSMTPAEWREVHIAEGVCPVGGCGAPLDEDFFCERCGVTSLPHKLVPEPQPVPELPEALTLDEFAPACLDAEEAA